jgi:hypothetical protein
MKCPFYKIHYYMLKSREIGRVGQTDFPQEVPYCHHPKHSPAPLRLVMNAMNVHLECGGDTTNCPLTPEQLVDLA